jgi:hypothetical protein
MKIIPLRTRRSSTRDFPRDFAKNDRNRSTCASDNQRSSLMVPSRLGSLNYVASRCSSGIIGPDPRRGRNGFDNRLGHDGGSGSQVGASSTTASGTAWGAAATSQVSIYNLLTGRVLSHRQYNTPKPSDRPEYPAAIRLNPLRPVKGAMGCTPTVAFDYSCVYAFAKRDERCVHEP